MTNHIVLFEPQILRIQAISRALALQPTLLCI